MRQSNDEYGSAIDGRQVLIPFRLQDDREVIALGEGGPSLPLRDIGRVRLCPSGGMRLYLELEGIDGKKIAIRWHTGSPGASSFFSFSTELLTRIAQRNQFVTFSIGPSRRTWIAAWICFIILIGMIIGITWAALTGRGLPTVSLPMALAPIALVVVLPILLNGPCRTVGLQQLINTLANLQPTANQRRKSG